MNVTIIGATGLVGSACLDLLQRDPATTVHIVVRRAPATTAPNVIVHTIPDFANLGAAADAFRSDAVICALGTTLKAAGSRDEFRVVDHDYAVASAELAAKGGASHFLLVSALGADATSRIFYNQVKGETERDVLALSIARVTIVRPSLLLGDREEWRTFEQIAKLFAPLIAGRPRPVQSGDVARVLVTQARERTPGHRIIESEEIRALSARLQ